MKLFVCLLEDIFDGCQALQYLNPFCPLLFIHIKTQQPGSFCLFPLVFANLLMNRHCLDYLVFCSLGTILLRCSFISGHSHIVSIMIASYFMEVLVFAAAGCFSFRRCLREKLLCETWDQTSSWNWVLDKRQRKPKKIPPSCASHLYEENILRERQRRVGVVVLCGAGFSLKWKVSSYQHINQACRAVALKFTTMSLVGVRHVYKGRKDGLRI